MPPAFFYFDLGNVLLNFDHRIAARQMAEVAGVEEEAVWQTVFGGDLLRQIETGELDGPQFYEAFCLATNTRADYARLALAGSEIFHFNTAILPIVGHLRHAGHRLGILSNTSVYHWDYAVSGRYGVIPRAFEVVILSYEVRAMKPDPKIYQVAAERAGVQPREIFFVDDRPENVAGALAAGFDAVLYTSATQLIRDLAQRGVRTNL